MDPQLRLQRAQSLVNDELLNEAFDTLREEMMQRWENSASSEVDARESLWLGLQLLARVRRHIHSIIETGKMAKMREHGPPFI